MTTEVFSVDILVQETPLGSFQLEWNPQPGAQIEIEGAYYVVLERRHRYRLSMNRYELDRVLLSVQKIEAIADRSWIGGRWVIGDMSCRYNARSTLLRCAVNPDGPCDRCPSYQPQACAGDGDRPMYR
ncbi:DUF6464 family protein [Lyngbya confervoides]|uniref:DUF6464 family protein n=1 Tax=Lyngbya confervoides BDU141951 TaxID=1574623 RepID=A0ABD4T1W2_9CYAN|nr:DUF6464 family protein [Lyngbya confervoides]MCM1982621.1 DUF6464 family protein [Lyngbya confervoides BDU141951]